MNIRLHWFVATLFLFVPATAWSCEPIIPLAQLLSGSSLVGPGFLTGSVLWLCAAIVIKCTVFARLERRLSWREALIAMLLANVISTIPGVMVAAFAGSGGSGVLLGVPFVLLLGCAVGRRIAITFAPTQTRLSVGAGAALGFFGLVFVSGWTYIIAQLLLDSRNYGEYWVLKFLFVALTASTGIVISAVLEEYVIGRLSRRRHGELTFYRPVVRANYITLALILLVAALQMLPKRLSDPNFIVSWLQSVSALFV